MRPFGGRCSTTLLFLSPYKLARQVLQTFGDEPFTPLVFFCCARPTDVCHLGLRLSGEFRELEKRDPRSRCVCVQEPVDNGTERYQDEQMVRADDGPTLVSG